MIRTCVAQSVCLILVLTSMVRAEFVQPGWTRPDSTAAASESRTTYQSWDLFIDDDEPGVPPIVDSTPDVANINPNGSAAVMDSSGAIVTGSGNIYNPVDRVDIAITVPGYGAAAGDRTEFLLQLKTLGSELVRMNPEEEVPVYDFSSFLVDGVPMESLASFAYTELSREAGFGATVEHAFSFAVPYSSEQFSLAYRSLASSSSQDLISVDTVVVPEPSGALLFGLALVGMAVAWIRGDTDQALLRSMVERGT